MHSSASAESAPNVARTQATASIVPFSAPRLPPGSARQFPRKFGIGPPFKPQRPHLKYIAKRMLYLPIVVYLALLVYAAFFSDSAIFLPHPSSYQDTPEILKIRTETGRKISAVYLPNPAAKYTLLVSHGNAEDIGDDRFWLQDLYRTGFSVLA